MRSLHYYSMAFRISSYLMNVSNYLPCMGNYIPLIYFIHVHTIHLSFIIDQLLKLIAMHQHHNFHFRLQDERYIHKISFKFITKYRQGLLTILFQLLQPLTQVGDLLLSQQFVLQDYLIQLVQEINLAPQQLRIRQRCIIGVDLYNTIIRNPKIL